MASRLPATIGLDDDARGNRRGAGGGDGIGVAQANMDEAEVAFVRDALGDALQHHRVTEAGGGGDGVGG